MLQTLPELTIGTLTSSQNANLATVAAVTVTILLLVLIVEREILISTKFGRERLRNLDAVIVSLFAAFCGIAFVRIVEVLR